MKRLENIQIKRINSDVFNGGLLTGGDYYNYQVVSWESHPELFKFFKWRAAFYAACNACNVLPQEAAAIFASSALGVKSNWFLIYQCSDRHKDYPERIHAAWSEDLVHWIKVKNSEPLFKRGSSGNWDQGAIWTGDVIAFKDRLYMFYEGWGRPCAIQDRNVDYFKGGRSQVGLASVSIHDFKSWCVVE